MLKSESRVEKGEGSVSSEGNHPGNWFANIFKGGDQREQKADPSAEQSQMTVSQAPPSPSPSPIPELPGSFLVEKSYPRGAADNQLPAMSSSFGTQMELAVAITRKLVDNYMEIVERNVADMVPKAIMRFLVNRSRKGLHQHLIATLYKCLPARWTEMDAEGCIREDLFSELMSEKPEIAERRRNCAMALAALREAIAALDSLPQELARRGATITGPSTKPFRW